MAAFLYKIVQKWFSLKESCSLFFLSKHGFGFGSFLHHYVRKKKKKKQQRVMLVVFAAVVNPDINKQDSLKMATL
mgnify:CR=1 FL=1